MPAEVSNLYTKLPEVTKHRSAETASLTVQTLKLSNVEPGQDLDGRPLLDSLLKWNFFAYYVIEMHLLLQNRRYDQLTPGVRPSNGCAPGVSWHGHLERALRGVDSNVKTQK